MNKSLPTMVDGSTRLERVQMAGHSLVYAYSITDSAYARKMAADPIAFGKTLGPRLCEAQRDLSVKSTRFDYFDPSQALVASFTAIDYVCDKAESVIVAEVAQLDSFGNVAI